MSRPESTLFNQLASAAFFPRPDVAFGPDAAGAFDHLFDVEDGVRLRLRFFLTDESQAPAILFFHGNGETARDYDQTAEAYRALPASLVVAEYRGYGPSTGKPSFDTFLTDAHRTLDEMRSVLEQRGHAGPLVAMGRSLGSSPAIELASSRPKDIAALIIESGFADVVPLMELLGVPARAWGITEKQGPQNRAKMGRIDIPTLFLHAELDQIIPIRAGEDLFDACKDPEKKLLRVPNAGHNDIQFVAGELYFDAIRELLRRIR